MGNSDRVVVDGLCDADADTVSRLGAQVPDEGEVSGRDRSGDVGRGIAQTDGENLCGGGCGEQTGAERQDTTAIGGCGFRKDGYAAIGVLAQKSSNVDEFCAWGRDRLGLQQGIEHCAPQTDGQEVALMRKGLGEDGVEDGGEVEGIDGRGVGRGDDRGGMRQAMLVLAEGSGVVSGVEEEEKKEKEEEEKEKEESV